MKQVLVVFLLFAGLESSVNATQENNSPNRVYGDSLINTLPGVEQMFQEILDISGVDVDLYLRAADVLNLEASIYHKKKYISYNPAYIEWITDATGDKWATMALLAHEIGHHIKGHTTTRRKGDRLVLELEADEYAGSVLYKLGATLEQAQKVMNYIARKTNSETHPARASRLQAIKTGWTNASNGNLASVSVK